jgi:hypothetical protein
MEYTSYSFTDSNFIPRVKVQRHEADLSPQSRAEVKKVELNSYLYLPARVYAPPASYTAHGANHAPKRKLTQEPIRKATIPFETE